MFAVATRSPNINFAIVQDAILWRPARGEHRRAVFTRNNDNRVRNVSSDLAQKSKFTLTRRSEIRVHDPGQAILSVPALIIVSRSNRCMRLSIIETNENEAAASIR